MSDRELLEKAAKAAEFGGGKFCWTESEYPRQSGSHGALWNYVGHMDTAELWNPLTDDGDALRLAVKLRISLTMRAGGCVATDLELIDAYEPFGNDPYAATRRAIVRAAAAMADETEVTK